MNSENIKKLETALFVKSQQIKMTEPYNFAAGVTSRKVRHYQRQWQYCKEIIRIKKELKLTIELARTPCSEQLLQNAEMYPEESVIYYQGIFLDLVHQLKDKLLKLTYLITDQKVFPPKVPDFSYTKLINEFGEELKKTDLIEVLAFWSDKDEITKSSAGIALNKRTNHHHFISPLQYVEAKSDINFARMMSVPEADKNLTTYGKEKIKAIGEVGMKKLIEDGARKMEKTFEDISENLESYSLALIGHFDLPVDPKEQGIILNQYVNMESSFEPKNETSLEKIRKIDKDFFDQLIKFLESNMVGEYIEAIYVVGSIARGEYVLGESDRNLYIIAKSGLPISEQTLNLFKKLSDLANVEVLIISLDEFNSHAKQKERFICRYDGLLLWGKLDTLQKESFPQIGIKLAWLLNENFPTSLNALNLWIEKNPNPPEKSITNKIRKLGKSYLDLFYASVMVNKPMFTFSRQGRIEAIISEYPEKENAIKALVAVVKSPLPTIKHLKELLGLGETLKEVFWDKINQNIQELNNLESGTIQ